ncbi:lipid IV(A) palmitoyltransferase PagP, partial [Enterobacteriaceae bacterium S5_ASV_15]|nr:lipid IV(A) palmitoyltransferase PagP [Enterobacteriaceae bacterium S5_ASV_15]
MIVRIKSPLILLFIIAQLSFAFSVNAQSNTADKSWFTTFTDNVEQTWNEPEH